MLKKNCPPYQILFINPVDLREVLHKNKKYWKYAGVNSDFGSIRRREIQETFCYFTPAQTAFMALCAGVFSFFFLFSQNFMLIIRVEERYLILRKRFFNLPMTRFKCFQCHIVPRSCLQVAKYILKWTTSEVIHLGKAKARNY